MSRSPRSAARRARLYRRACRAFNLTPNLAEILDCLHFGHDPDVPTADVTFRAARALERRGFVVNLPTLYTRITPAGLSAYRRASNRFHELTGHPHRYPNP